MTKPRPSYSLSMRFPTIQAAKRVYNTVEQALLVSKQAELSAFNFLLDGVPTVAVVGDPPDTVLHDRLMAVMDGGDPVTLPESVLRALHLRRQDQKRLAPWVERHHRPGRRFPIEDE